MGTEHDDELLAKLADGGVPHSEIFPTPDAWPRLLESILARIDKIAHEDFPIPKLPPPAPKWDHAADRPAGSPLPSSPLERPGSSDANKENAAPSPAPPAPAQQQPATGSPPAKQVTTTTTTTTTPGANSGEPTSLPPQIRDMLSEITTALKSFPAQPPHTIQRVAELILTPRRHYRALASYLHALDRVVHVTSPSSAYPLPLPSVTFANGGGPADTISWANAAQNNPGSDEALGGALLTPIPWLPKDPPTNAPSSSSSSQRELRTESTETIEGPNGVGSVETVSISVGGMGLGRGLAAQQGEMRHQDGASQPSSAENGGERRGEEEEEEQPHARGPEEIGARDLGPTVLTINRIDENSLHPQEIDLEAAVGRKLVSRATPSDDGAAGEEAGEPAPAMAVAVEDGDDAAMEGADSAVKRGAEEEPEGELSPKKARSEDEDMGGVEES